MVKADRFDEMIRAMTASRRVVLSGVLVTVAGSLGLVGGNARKKRNSKNGPKKPKFNDYGCLNAGQPCRGKSSLCCSGICEGKKPKKGKKDTSRCVGHDADICTLETNSCDVGVDVPRGEQDNRRSVCTRTTGNAGFCADISAGTETHCRVCTKDTDCQPEFGPGAACVVLGDGCTPLCIHTGRTACLPPSL